MSAESDKTLEQPVDDLIRRQAIIHVTRQRLIIFCAALVVTGCAVAMNLTRTHNPRSRGFTDIAAVLLWLVVFRIGANLRALSGVEPTIKQKDDEAEARLKSWRPPAKP